LSARQNLSLVFLKSFIKAFLKNIFMAFGGATHQYLNGFYKNSFSYLNNIEPREAPP
jgi:hypothetical protein